MSMSSGPCNIAIYGSKTYLIIKNSKSLTGYALTWALSKKKISTLILGVTSQYQLHVNIKSLDSSFHSDEYQYINQILGDLNQYQKYGLGVF